MFLIRPINSRDLALVLQWRNSARIRQNMIQDQLISWEEHCAWFENLQHRSDREVLLFSIADKKVGIVSFVDINVEHKHCSWGFYIGEEAAPKGAGMLMVYHALNYIFAKNDLHKIKAEVLDCNKASLEFHKKLGYRPAGVLPDEILRNGKYYDLVLFSLFETDWQIAKESIYQQALAKMKGVI